MRVNYKILIRKNKTDKSGLHPVAIRFYIDGKQSFYHLSYYTSKKNWNDDSECFNRGEKDFKAKNNALASIQERIQEKIHAVIKDGESISAQEIRDLIFNGNDARGKLLESFQNRVKLDFDKGKYTTANAYLATHNVLKKFCKGNDPYFESVTPKFLEQFEVYLVRNKRTGGGIHHHMRNIRSVFNKAIRDGLVDDHYYPFSRPNKKGYSLSKLKSNAKPRGLTEVELKKLKLFKEAKTKGVEEAYHLFMFSYYTRGTNFSDMARLKWSDIKENVMHYRRQKTETEMKVTLTENALYHLNKIARRGYTYVFPILEAGDDKPQVVLNKIKNKLKRVNNNLKTVAESVGIEPKNFTTYVARHSFANVIFQKGESYSTVGQALGHKDSKVTKAYLHRLSEDSLHNLDRHL